MPFERCPVCNYVGAGFLVGIAFTKCPQCGFDENSDDDVAKRESREREEREQAKNRLKNAALIPMTTLGLLSGHKTTETLGVVTAECAFGMNIFRDFFTSMSDFFGGRSEATQNVLRDARQTCLHELSREAKRIGANAVLGVRLDYSEFSGKGKSMLFLVASGTAVKVKPISEDQAAVTDCG